MEFAERLWRELLDDWLALRLRRRDPILDVRRDVAVDFAELLLGQRQTVPSSQRVLRPVVARRGVAPVKQPVRPDLANAGYEQVSFVLPHARYGYSTDIEINISHSRIFSLDCFHEY